MALRPHLILKMNRAGADGQGIGEHERVLDVPRVMKVAGQREEIQDEREEREPGDRDFETAGEEEKDVISQHRGADGQKGPERIGRFQKVQFIGECSSQRKKAGQDRAGEQLPP